MDKKTVQNIKVGVFVSAGLLLAMISIFFISEKSFFERHYILYSRFTEIQGLRKGAPVFLAGIQVGTVDDIMFPEKLEEKGVLVKMEIARRFYNRIRGDSEAMVATQGLLGDKAVLLTVGTPSTPPLEDGAVLKTKKGTSIEGFAELAEEFLNRGQRLVDNIDGLVTDIKQKDSMVHALIYDAKGKQIVGELSDVTRSASDLLRDLKKSGAVANFSAAAKNMKSSTENLNSVTAKIEKGEGTVGGLISDPTVYYDLKTLMGKANRSKLLKIVIRHVLSKNEKDTLK